MTLSALGFASATRSSYLTPMFMLPRPVSPRSALADLKLMFAADRPHRWGLLGLSAAITFVVLWGFMLESRKPKPERQIIYVQSWMADRKDSDIIRQQLKDLDHYEADLQKSQVKWQQFADAMGIEWRKDEAANRARRAATTAAMKKHLEQKLAETLKREAVGGQAPGDSAPQAAGMGAGGR